jgi:hypothetical protein
MSRTELLQRAIHSAKCRIYRINYDLNCDISLNHQKKAENQKELMDITVEALEKQIPKKPLRREDTTYSFCPCCNSGNLMNDYCTDCGQKIDWEDTE